MLLIKFLEDENTQLHAKFWNFVKRENAAFLYQQFCGKNKIRELREQYIYIEKKLPKKFTQTFLIKFLEEENKQLQRIMIIIILYEVTSRKILKDYEEKNSFSWGQIKIKFKTQQNNTYNQNSEKKCKILFRFLYFHF